MKVNRFSVFLQILVAAFIAATGWTQDPVPSPGTTETRPIDTRPLALPGQREIPRSDAAIRDLVHSVKWAIESERQKVATKPDPRVASLIDVLDRQARSLEALLKARSELESIASDAAKLHSLRESTERRLTTVIAELKTPTGLTDPLVEDAESKLRIEKATAESSAKAVVAYRSQLRQQLERLRADGDAAPGQLAQSKAELRDAVAAEAAADRTLERGIETGLSEEARRTLEENIWLAKVDMEIAQTRINRWELRTGSSLDEQIRSLTFQISAEDSKLAMYEARTREAAHRISIAGGVRFERSELELRALRSALSTAADWMQPWYRAKITLTEARQEAIRAQRLAESWRSRLDENGEIGSLEAEAESDEANFREVEAGRLEIGEVAASSSGGVRALVEEVRDELRTIDAFLLEARRDSKDLRDRLRLVRGESPELVARRVEGSALAAPRDFVPTNNEERDAVSPRGFTVLATDLRAASKERADAFAATQRHLADATTRLNSVRAKVERTRLRLEDIQRWIRDDNRWNLDGLLSDLKLAPDMLSRVGIAVVDAHRRVAEKLSSALRAGPRAWGAPLVSLLTLMIAVVAALRGARRLTWPSPGPRLVPRAVLAVLSAAGGALWLPMLIVSVSVIPALLLDVDGTTLGVVASTSGVLAGAIAGRSIVALLVGRSQSDPRILHTSDAMAGVFRSTFHRLLVVGVVLLPIAGLCEALAAPPSPWPDLAWAVFSFLVEIIVLLAFTRRRAMPAVIQSVHAMGGSARLLLWVAYPAAILATVFLATLQVLSYSVAYAEFRGRFLATALWLFLGWAVRGWIVRAALGAVPARTPPESEPNPCTPDWRRRATTFARDRLVRVVASSVYLPVLWLVAQAWGLTGQGWDAHFSSKIPFLSDTLTIGDVIQATITIFIANAAIRLGRDLLRYRALPATDLDPGLRYAIVTLTTYLLVTVFAIFILNRQLHLDPSHIGWFVTALGLGVGFGLQEIINNFVSGLILLVERPIKVGDVIAIDGITGRVEVINMRSTTVMTVDHMGLIVPNKDLISTKVTNWSSGAPYVRAVVPFGVAYGTDLAKVEAIVLDLIKQRPSVLTDPAPDVSMSAFAASSIDFELSFFVPLQANRGKIRSEVMRDIERAFAAHGIEIPFPQQDVRIRSTPKD